MNNCKYCKIEVTDGHEHTYCSNEELKKINKSKEDDIPCLCNALPCVLYEERNEIQEEVKK